MDGMNDLVIGQDGVGMWHPGLVQISDLCRDQSITEAALQASGGDHVGSLRAETDWPSTMRRGVPLASASQQEKMLIRLLRCWFGFDSDLSKSV